MSAPTSSLLGWVHRIRDLGGVTFLDIRDRAGVSQVVVRENDALMTVAKRLRSEFVVGRVRRRPAAVARYREPEARHRRGRGPRARDPAAERSEDAAVPDRGRRPGVGRRAPQVPLPRSAPAAPAVQHGAAAPRVDRDPEILRRQRLLGDRDADPGQVDAGRRARLPGAEPRPPGRVLRAAAVAADLQADPDDRRHRPLLPDRALLPRRGSARRPAARVHPGRRRGVVRAARDDLRPDRAADAADLQARSARRSRCRSGGWPYAEAIARYGSDKPDLRCGMEIHDLSEVFRDVGIPRLQADRRRRRRGARLRGQGRQRILAQPARRASSIRRRRSASPD